MIFPVQMLPHLATFFLLETGLFWSILHVATAWDHLEIESNAECHNSACHSALRSLYTGAQVLQSFSVTIWVKLLIFNSLLLLGAVGVVAQRYCPWKCCNSGFQHLSLGKEKGGSSNIVVINLLIVWFIPITSYEAWSFCFALNSAVDTYKWSAMAGNLIVPSFWVIFALSVLIALP